MFGYGWRSGWSDVPSFHELYKKEITMTERNFMEMLRAKFAEKKFLCVGLDSDNNHLPLVLDNQFEFNKVIVNATHDIVCAYKLNIAFYSALGQRGELSLHQTIHHIKEIAPDVPIILDSKRGDIGNTNAGYVAEVFKEFNADAVTVNPYFGEEALAPFLEKKEKGIIVLCRTSNPGAGEFQDLEVRKRDELSLSHPEENMCVPLYQYVAHRISSVWNKNENCMVVAGATTPEELASIRTIVGDMPILIPGIGAQGGDLEATVVAGMDSRGEGMVINSSRGIIFASKEDDFAEAARREALKTHENINTYRTQQREEV